MNNLRGVLKHRRAFIIAHRGASAVAPESTQAAIQKAIAAGVQMIELDVQMTRDGRLVIFHDDRLDRTTHGTGRLAKRSYQEIADLDAGSWFSTRFKRERILLASQALRLVPIHIWVNLELKRIADVSRRRAFLKRIHRLVRAPFAKSRILLSSFDRAMLEPFRRGGLPLALICRRDPEWSLRQAILLGARAWHPLHTLVSLQRIKQAHAAGLWVHPWTVDEPTRARQLIRWGVDGIFTNHPAQISRVLRNQWSPTGIARGSPLRSRGFATAKQGTFSITRGAVLRLRPVPW